ncbi:MAG: hypothetical protein AAGI48_13620 [Verrucomicrobiota bacterium]
MALKYTAKRLIKTDHQKEMELVMEFCVNFAGENPTWSYGRIRGSLSKLGY